jgi:thioredoxin reductase (NADPH)
MSAYLIEELTHLPNVELRFQTEVVDADGARGLEQVTLRDRRTGALEAVRTHALFVMIGASPHTEWLEGVIERDEHGFVVTGSDLAVEQCGRFGAREPMLLETSMPGVFAAGDVRHASTKPVGEGTVAVRIIHEYLAQVPPPTPTRSPDVSPRVHAPANPG